MSGITCNILMKPWERLFEMGFCIFCNILISLVPYSFSVLALTYPQGTDRKSALGVGTHGRCLNVRAHGEAGVSGWAGDSMGSLSWSQAGTAQIRTKLILTVNTPQTHPSSSELSFLPPLLSPPSPKGAAAAAKVPRVQNAQ